MVMILVIITIVFSMILEVFGGVLGVFAWMGVPALVACPRALASRVLDMS